MSAILNILCLVGPTCSGKSAAAMRIASQGLQGKAVEIISMDSALVYRGMDIGTAKPTREEMQRVPHHLIDIIEPTQSYSAAQFARDATRIVHEVRERGNEPLIVGGTMLYLKALREGLNVMPTSDSAIRAQIDAEAAASSWPAMHALLQRIDPITAERLNPNDQQRIQRALEVWRISGKPLSSFHADADAVSATPLLPVRVLSIEPEDRIALHAKIAERFHAMLKLGFLDEVRALIARGNLNPDLASMRCVGYRQAWEHLEAQCDYASFVEKGIAATRQLAKRQLTWLRGMSDIERIGDADSSLLALAK